MATVSSSSSSPFTVSGLASGIDTTSIINALVQVDSQPLNLVKTNQSNVKAHLAAIQQLNTNMLAIGDALDPLIQNATFAAKSATSSNPTALSVSAASNANAGVLNLSIKNLATPDQYVTATPQSTASDALGSTGDITLQTASGQAVTVTPTDYSLNGIATAINNAKAGINAAVINDGVGYRLLLTSAKTGYVNGISQVTGTGDLAAILGSSGVDGLTQVSGAQDAQIRLGDPTTGLLITSPTNTVTTAVPGLTLNLTAPADNIAVTVSADGGSVGDKISAFADAYNAAQTFFAQNSGYNATTKTAGQLFSDGLLRSQLQGLRNAATVSVASQPDGFKSLKDIGVTISDTGQMIVDATKLQSKLEEDSGAVSSLFKGIATGVNAQLDRLTQSGSGSLALEQDQLNGQIKSMDDRIAQLNKQVDARKTMYQNQFNAMETMISQLNSQSQALTSFVNAYTSSKK